MPSFAFSVAVTLSAPFSSFSTVVAVRIFMPCFLKAFSASLGNLFVLDRQHAVQHFDHRDLGAEGVEEAGEFDADGAGADHQQLLRHDIGHQRFAIGPDQLAVRLQPGQRTGARAGGEHDVLGGVIGSLAVPGDG